MRVLLLAVASALVLTGCGGRAEAGPSETDTALCDQQAADLSGVRDLVADLSEPDSRWAPGEAAAAVDTAGDAVTALTGYAAEGERLAGIVDRAREAVQALHDDLADDQTLEGDGQTVRTADAALGALTDVCS